MKTLKYLLLSSCLIFTSFAFADSWEFEKSDDGDCRITSVMNSNADAPYISFQIEPTQQLRIGMIDDRWKSIQADKEYSVTFDFKDVENGVWTVALDGWAEDGLYGLYGLYDQDIATRFLQDFSKGNRLTALINGNEIFSKSLSGSMKAYYRALECSSIKSDPFSSSPSKPNKQSQQGTDPFSSSNYNNKSDLVVGSSSGAIVLYDNNLWEKTDKKFNPEQDQNWIHKSGSVYAALIDEELEIAPDILANIAFGQIQSVAESAVLIQKKEVTINGFPAILMEVNGTVSGIDATYIGYFVSRSEGSTQLITWTGTKLIEKYRSVMMSFLQGLTL